MAPSVPSLADVVRSLTAARDVPSLVTERAHRDEASAVLGPGPVEWAVQVVRDTVDLVEPSEAVLGSPDIELHRAGEVLLLGILLELLGGAPAETYFAGVHRQRERRATSLGAPLDAGITIARLAQEVWTQLLLDHAHAEGAPGTVMRDITVVVGACFDRFVDLMGTARQIERERLAAEHAARRRRLIEALVGGDPVDAGEVLDRLGVDLGHHHLAMVVTPRGERDINIDKVERAVARVWARLAAPTVTCHVPSSGAALWAWVTVARPLGANVVVDLTALADADAHVGLGAAHPGADGFRRSHLEAADAERLARGPRGPMTCHDDVTLSALLSVDLERARWFVRDELGSLADPGPTMAELRHTLQVLYHSGMRLATTAARMHLHRNTLIRRLERIEKLLGRRVNDRVAETQGAIQLVEDLGEQVLRPPTTG